MRFTIAHQLCGIGGIDFDPLARRDFAMLTGTPVVCADVHELEPADLRRFLGHTAPDVVMLRPPCKGCSGLRSARRAAEPKDQRMNQMMERAPSLVYATWPRAPRLIFEIAPKLHVDLTEEQLPEWYRLSRVTSAGIAVATIERAGYETRGRGSGVVMDVHARPEIAVDLADQRRWFFPDYIGYVPRDVRALAEPVSCRGWQGFWTLPPDVDAAVRRQIRHDHPPVPPANVGRISAIKGPTQP